MKATGVVRKVDELGRIVLPIELRRNMDINIKDSIEIYVDGESIILKKYQPCCVFCGEANDMKYTRTRGLGILPNKQFWRSGYRWALLATTITT